MQQTYNKKLLLLTCLLSTFFILSGLKAQTLSTVTDTLLNQKQKDRLYLTPSGSEDIAKFKKDFTEHKVLLMAGMNFAKQNIHANDYTSPFIYVVEQKNVYKPGFIAGFRVDGKYKEKNLYALALTLNNYSNGVNYQETKAIEPFIGAFSNFKATEQSLSFNMTALYKKLIPILDTAKYKFYVVAGPSMDIRLSGQGMDNLANQNYRRLFLKAALGLEFDNNSYYTFFFHYKHSLYSVTKSPVQTQFNNFDLGMLIKASDLF